MQRNVNFFTKSLWKLFKNEIYFCNLCGNNLTFAVFHIFYEKCWLIIFWCLFSVFKEKAIHIRASSTIFGIYISKAMLLKLKMVQQWWVRGKSISVTLKYLFNPRRTRKRLIREHPGWIIFTPKPLNENFQSDGQT